jgi:hypothetical protein
VQFGFEQAVVWRVCGWSTAWDPRDQLWQDRQMPLRVQENQTGFLELAEMCSTLSPNGAVDWQKLASGDVLWWLANK